MAAASQRKRSAVWNHFDSSEPKKAKCNYCANILAIPSGNTGNLSRHLKMKHPTVQLVTERQACPLELQSMNPDMNLHILSQAPQPSTSGSITSSAQTLPTQQPSIRDFAQNLKPIPPRRAELVDEQLVRMIAKGYYPFSMVEDAEFKKFLLLLCPGYTLPTRKTLSESLLQKMYQREMETVREKMKGASGFCLTTDGWTSCNNDSYLAVTAHYIKSTAFETKLMSSMIGCVEYNERHTSENLTEFLDNIIKEWNMDGYVTAIASDNAANITAAIKMKWAQIPCFAHTLNLCVQTALKHLSVTLVKVKSIVEFFKRSTQAMKKLSDIQKQLNLPELKLKQDVVTRWNSTYEMLHRMKCAKDAIMATIAILRSDLALNSYDWAVIEAAVPVLELFYQVTCETSGEKQVTLSKVGPICRIMRAHVKDLLRSCGNIPEIKLLVETLDRELEKRFSAIECNHLNAESTILDPRFKHKGFRDPRVYELAIGHLKQKIGNQRLLPTASNTLAGQSTSTAAAGVSNTVSTLKAPSIWDNFDKEVARLTPENPTAAGIVELNKYLQEPILARTQDPLQWWHARKDIYPLLYNFMKRRQSGGNIRSM